MEDVLKRLLETEARAEALIEAADRERQGIVDAALEEARRAEERFQAGLPEIRAPFLAEAASRGDQQVAELVRKYEERQKDLRDLAARHEEEAVSAVLALLLDPER